MTDDPTWLTGLRAKRPLQWLRCLTYLLDAARRKGYCSANDVPDTAEFAEPNVIGACFRDLGKFGLRKTHLYEPCKARRKHGREVPRWIVRDYAQLIGRQAQLTGMVGKLTEQDRQNMAVQATMF